MIYEHMQHNFLSNKESSTLIVNKHDIYYTKSKQRISWERLEGNIEVVVILKWYKKEADGGRKQTACFYFLPYHKPSQGASLISNNWANVFSPLTLHSIFVHYLNTVFLKKKKNERTSYKNINTILKQVIQSSAYPGKIKIAVEVHCWDIFPTNSHKSSSDILPIHHHHKFFTSL